MEKKQKLICASVLMVLGTLMFTNFLFAEQTACLQDLRPCPDGTVVGRTGPNCEFICPPAVPLEKIPAGSNLSTPKQILGSEPAKKTDIAQIDTPVKMAGNPNQGIATPPIEKIPPTKMPSVSFKQTSHSEPVTADVPIDTPLKTAKYPNYNSDNAEEIEITQNQKK